MEQSGWRVGNHVGNPDLKACLNILPVDEEWLLLNRQCRFHDRENLRGRFSGIRNSMRQPCPGWLDMWQLPPSSRIRRDILPRPLRPGLMPAGSKPLPLSCITTTRSRLWRSIFNHNSVAPECLTMLLNVSFMAISRLRLSGRSASVNIIFGSITNTHLMAAGFKYLWA